MESKKIEVPMFEIVSNPQINLKDIKAHSQYDLIDNKYTGKIYGKIKWWQLVRRYKTWVYKRATNKVFIITPV